MRATSEERSVDQERHLTLSTVNRFLSLSLTLPKLPSIAIKDAAAVRVALECSVRVREKKKEREEKRKQI